MKRSLIQLVIEHIFGRKYYANIVSTVGTQRCDICSFVFPTRQEAEQHRRELDLLASFRFVETISFRSRNIYTTGSVHGINCTVCKR